MFQRILSCIVTIVLLFCMLSSCNEAEINSNSNNHPPSINNSDTIDITAFQGSPDIDIHVDIEEDLDSKSYDDCIITVTNKTGKSITELKLYLIRCFDHHTPLESTQYAERFSFKNINNEETQKGRWIIGKSDYSTVDIKVYLSYVAYEDGTTWGVDRAKHEAIITRNEQVNVCIISSATPTTKQKFMISYSANIISNSHVGDNWSYGMKSNDVFITPNTTVEIDVAENVGPRFKIYGVENDSDDDYGENTIRFPIIKVGETVTLTEQVMIVENNGKYVGNRAYIKFTVTITRIEN